MSVAACLFSCTFFRAAFHFLYLLLIDDVFEDLLDQAIKLNFFVKGQTEAVMDCLDRDVLLSEPFDDIFAHLCIEVHQA